MFKSYHFQDLKLILEKALFAGFLMIWLKKCVVPMHPHEMVLPAVAMPVVQLLTQYRVALLPALTVNLPYGLRQLVVEFLKGTANSREELPYTYLMA